MRRSFGQFRFFCRGLLGEVRCRFNCLRPDTTVPHAKHSCGSDFFNTGMFTKIKGEVNDNLVAEIRRLEYQILSSDLI